MYLKGWSPELLRLVVSGLRDNFSECFGFEDGGAMFLRNLSTQPKCYADEQPSHITVKPSNHIT
jgi:hypothetical protein